MVVLLAAAPVLGVQWLEQSAAVTVKMGPFVDETNGYGAEEGLAIAQADIRLSKNGGAFAQTNNAAGATHDENGYYGVPLDTTDTATLGTLRVAIAEAGALQVWQDFMVVPTNVWDSMFGADKLQVDLAQIKDTAIPAEGVGGQIAAGFDKFFDVGTPTGTVNSLPDAVAGAAGGVFIAGTNAATVVTTSFTTTFTGNLSGSVGDLLKISGSAAAANNAEIVFDTDFATNYDTTADTWTIDLDNVDGTLSDAEVEDDVQVDVKTISTDATAANNAELAFDGTGFGFTNCTMPTVTTTGTATTVTGLAANAIGVGDIASGAITADAIATNAIGAAEVADAALDKATFAADYWTAHTLLVHPGETVWYVSKDGQAADAGDGTAADPELTIGAALTDAASGDTIFIGPGTYSEQVDLDTANKSLTLRGAGIGKTIITQSGAAGTLVLEDDCTVRDLSAISTHASGYGVYGWGKTNFHLERVWGEGPQDGMVLGCDRLVLRGCVAKSTFDGMYASADYIFIENTVCFTDGSYDEGEVRALLLECGFSAVVSECTVVADRPGTQTDQAIGLYVSGGGKAIVRGTNIYVRASDGEQTADVWGVGAAVSGTSVLLDGCQIQTVNAGSGDAFDISNSGDSQVAVANTSYDTAKTSGTVTHVPPGAAILADTTIIGAPVGASLSADIAAIKAETVLVLADTDALETWWADDGRLDLRLDIAALGGGTVEHTYTLTSTVDESPIPQALVEVYTGSDKTGFKTQDYTDNFGVVVFHLNPGTYYFWRSKSFFIFPNPVTQVVEED